MKLLHLDSSILGHASVSRRLSAQIVARQRSLHAGLIVIYRDLAADPPLHFSGAHVSALQRGTAIDPSIASDLQKGSVYLEELFEADILVIGTPMYNLTIPTSLKAWIDRISLAGKTFRYTANGPEGLLLGKKAFIASSRGGVYSAGSALATLEHQETYLVDLLAFLGVTDVTVVRAEGVALGPDAKEAGVDLAFREIAALDL